VLGSYGLFLTFGRDKETAHSLKALPSTPSFSPESKITSGRYAEKLDHFLYDAVFSCSFDGVVKEMVSLHPELIVGSGLFFLLAVVSSIPLARRKPRKC